MFFLPYIIALLLGLISPATNSNNHCNNGGTVQINSAPGDPGDPEDPDGDGADGPGSGTGTGGGTSQTPPPKP